ncbi:CDP-alcohol phosphatidyltransferase family protein [Deinococcus sp.]|uniref:CDP-alcohol phosphatidyltransferase family protein n=1 Tax=Deinococcus sp. TaxID=47478 RepID=UPI003CC519CA
MTLYAVKPAFQRLLRPLAYALADRGITANAVTLSAMLLSVLLGALLADMIVLGWSRWLWLLLPVFLFVRMALNAIDGLMARERNQVSRVGAYLNELGDVMSDSALYLPFALLPGGWPAAVLVALSAAGELAGVLAQTQGAARRYDGPLGKSDRALWFSVLALLLAFGVRPGSWLSGVLLLGCLLSALTVWNRVRRGLAEVQP